MQRVVKVVAALAALVLLPGVVFAQATIAGVIRDASAAVLPGVSVEAASPVLIEKTRTVVSDGTGQYRITDVPPGTYVLTFSLTGFTTMKREGLAVSGSGVVTANADLRVATVQETVTVTAASPIVDTQSVRREVVLNNETLSTLPATRTTKSSPSPASNTASGGTRESLQPSTVAKGRCPWARSATVSHRSPVPRASPRTKRLLPASSRARASSAVGAAAEGLSMAQLPLGVCI